MAEVNYKTKYVELKQKFMNAVDTAFRLGVEQGMQQAQVQQAQQQQQDAQAMQQAAMGGQPDDGSGGAPGAGGDPSQAQPGQPGQPGEAGPPSEHPQGSELDQHIDALETAMGKAEKGSEVYKSLQKSLDGFKSVKAEFEFKAMLRKNESAIRAISNNMQKHTLPPVRTLNARAQKNLSEKQKHTLDMQQKIVDDCFKHWDAEETDMVGKVLEIVGNEGKLKKE